MPWDPDASTDTNVDVPWLRDSSPPPADVLHLVIAWFLEEADRTGQVARLDRPGWLGRGDVAGGDPARLLDWLESRPGRERSVPPIETSLVSRRQLLLSPESPSSVRVKNVGRRELLHNGRLVTECTAVAGDTLMLRNTAVFLLEARPAKPPALRHYGAPDFAFGAADPQGIVGESPAAWSLRDAVAGAAASQAHVLVRGESGAGKELTARAVHERSARAAGPFVARNAATIPAGLVDAELFGTARNYPNAGAAEREGLIGAADGGTLLLDEIGELPEAHQAHLLRVLDTGGEYHRLGESQARRSDFRLIAATNRPLDRLKHDLLARFAFRVEVPGLGARRSDIPLLVRVLLERIAEETPEVRERFFEGARTDGARMDPVLLDGLLRHRYTHHTRELERLLRTAIATSPADFLAATPEVVRELGAEEGGGGEVAEVLEQADERERAAEALAASGGNVSRAAERLGITRHAMHRVIRKYGLKG